MTYCDIFSSPHGGGGGGIKDIFSPENMFPDATNSDSG